MNTGATISVSDRYANFHIYTFWDVDPEFLGTRIFDDLAYTRDLSKFKAWDFATALVKILKTSQKDVKLISDLVSVQWTRFHYEIYEKNGELEIEISDFEAEAYEIMKERESMEEGL